MVKVEIRDDKCRAAIMKFKNKLRNHHDESIKRLIIKNFKTDNRLALDNFAHDVLKLIPGGSNLFAAPNGHLREKTQNYQEHSRYHQSSNIRHMTPATFQAQIDVPLSAPLNQVQHPFPASSMTIGSNHLQQTDFSLVSDETVLSAGHRTDQ